MKIRIETVCNRVIEGGWLAALVTVPLFFNVFSSRVFEPDKINMMRTIALIMVIAWIIKVALTGAYPGKNSEGRPWYRQILRQPLFIPVAVFVIVYIIATITSVDPNVSFWGSYQRLQGTYTWFCYIAIFAMVAMHLRTRVQLDTLLNTVIFTSVPIALYGWIQHNGWDQLPWGGDVIFRVSSTMGNPIFLAAYLIMVFPFTIIKIVSLFTRKQRDQFWPEEGSEADHSRNEASDVIALLVWGLLGLIMAISFFAPLHQPPTDGSLTGDGGTDNTLLGIGFIWLGTISCIVALAKPVIPPYPTASPSLNKRDWTLIGLYAVSVVLSVVAVILESTSGATVGVFVNWAWALVVIFLFLIARQFVVRLYLAPSLISEQPTGRSLGAAARRGPTDPTSSTVASTTTSPSPRTGATRTRAHGPARDSGTYTPASRGPAHLSGVSTFLFTLRIFGYVLALIVEALAILFTRSRGPWEGWAMGSFIVLPILLGIQFIRLSKKDQELNVKEVNRPKLGRIATALMAAWILILVGGGGFVLFLNTSHSSTEQSLSKLPYLSEASALFNTDEGTALVRVLIWDGGVPSTQLLKTIDNWGNIQKAWNSPYGSLALIRNNPILGVGPEAMYVAYNKYYPPQLGTIEARNASPDRSHDIYLDILVTTGVIGFIAYIYLLTAIAWYGIKFMMSNMSFYKQLFMIAITAAIVATLVEGLTGIAIVSTLTYFWIDAGLIIALMKMGETPQLATAEVAAGETESVAPTVTSRRAAAEAEVPVPLTASNRRTSSGASRAAAGRAAAARGGPSQRNGPNAPVPGAAKPTDMIWAALGLLVIIFLVEFINANNVQADMYYKMGFTFDSQNPPAYRASVWAYNKATEMQPRQDYYYLFFGRAYLELAKDDTDVPTQTADLEASQKYLLLAREINPLNTDHYANLGRLYRYWSSALWPDTTKPEPQQAADMATESLSWYKQAEALSPNNVEIYDEMSQVYLMQAEAATDAATRTANYSASLAQLDTSMKLDTTYAVTYSSYGDTYRSEALKLTDATQQTALFNKAISWYNQAVAKDDTLTQAWIALSDVQERMKDYNDAITAMKKAIALPDGQGNPRYLENLANLESESSAATPANCVTGVQYAVQALQSLQQQGADTADPNSSNGQLWSAYKNNDQIWRSKCPASATVQDVQSSASSTGSSGAPTDGSTGAPTDGSTGGASSPSEPGVGGATQSGAPSSDGSLPGGVPGDQSQSPGGVPGDQSQAPGGVPSVPGSGAPNVPIPGQSGAGGGPTGP